MRPIRPLPREGCKWILSPDSPPGGAQVADLPESRDLSVHVRMDLRELLDQFTLQQRANGRSAHTVTQYQRYVAMLETWLVAERRSTELKDIDPATLAGFLVSPTVRGRRGGGTRKATSTNAIRSALRVVFAFARDAGYADRNAAALVRRARCSSVMQRVLTADEQRRLEHELATARGPGVERDQVMVKLLLGCGLRVGSLAGLCAEDVVGDEILVRQAKNDAPIRVFVPRALRPLLDGYVESRTGPLFTGKGARPLSTRHISRRLRLWCERAGIEPVSPHALRRTFGTALYRATKDPFVVQRGLCHRSLGSALAYVCGVEERLREVVAG